MRFLAVLVVVQVVTIGESAAQEKPASNAAAARAFLDKLAKGDFAGGVETFDATMKKVMPKDKLETTWKTLTEQAGEFKKQGKARLAKKDEYEIVIITCQFAKGNLDARVVFDKERKIAGLFFVPVRPAVVYRAPVYVKRATFLEHPVVVGEGEWALPGTLSVPKGKGPFPAVVLSPGSGPQDRDETIGPNKPLKDIAWGLASRGIVVLRFDRRTYTHSARMAAIVDKVTVKEEVIDDVNAAVALLKGRADVDPKRIYLLGHSLGAMLAPRIAQGNADIHGLVLLAAPGRSFEDLILEQVTYLGALKGKLSDKHKAELEKIKKQVAKVRDPKLSPDVPAKDLPLGVMPARYWLSLRGDLAPQAAKKLARPMLVLQGERDYQVTMEDFRIWQDVLKDRKDVTFKSYPRLHHLFLVGSGAGKSQPSEYEMVGHVPAEVIEDIAGFLKSPK